MPTGKMPNPTVVRRNLRRDAETLVERGHAEVQKDMRAGRRGAARTARLEREVMRQFHAAADA